MHEIIKDRNGRLVPVVRPKNWQARSIRASKERSERINRARKERSRWLATTRWEHALDREAIGKLEAMGTEWAAVQRWFDNLDPREAFGARLFVKQVLQVLVDAAATSRGRLD